jgi:HAD superfamily hydrolase (TIGR01509 family)
MPSDHIYTGVVDELKRRYSEGLGVFPGAVDAVADLAKRFRMGVASGSPTELIEHALQIAGMRQHFELVVSADEVSHGKPLPDVYLLACSRLSVDPKRSAAVEDSGNGIKAAVAAGLAVVAIPNLEFPPAPEVVRLARVVLPAIAELTSATIDAIEMGSDV